MPENEVEVAQRIAELFDIPTDVMQAIVAEADAARRLREAREAQFWARTVATVDAVNEKLAPYGMVLSLGDEDA